MTCAARSSGWRIKGGPRVPGQHGHRGAPKKRPRRSVLLREEGRGREEARDAKPRRTRRRPRGRHQRRPRRKPRSVHQPRPAPGPPRRSSAALPADGAPVLITGVSGFWGTELARRLERSPDIDYIAGLDVRPPPADLGRTEFIRADVRNPLLSRLLPQTEVDTVVHCDVLLVPEPGKAPRQLHDINVIGSLQLLAAVREDGHGAHDRRARVGSDLRGRAECARVLHRGHGPELPAPHPLPARRRRARELLRELLTPLSAHHGDDAPLPADARCHDRLAAHALPPAAARRDPARLRPAAPVRERAGCGGRARSGGATARARARERRRGGEHLAQQAAATGREGAVPVPAPLFGAALGAGGGSASRGFRRRR